MFGKYKLKNNKGSILLYVMIFGTLAFSFVVIGVSSYALSEYKATVYRENQEKAFQIAEAGVNYYKWHLVHDPFDYQDGTGAPGPYVHPFKDKNGTEIGYFSLTITTSTSNSIITVESEGWVKNQEQSKRKIRARIRFSSLTEYSMVSNSGMWIGDDSVVSGRMHSNTGIRFDGITNAPITSAVESYLCAPVHGSGCGHDTYKPGIWGSGGPKSLWFFPVPAEDFGGVANSLLEISTKASEGGLYLSDSNEQGWRLRFIGDGTVGVAKVEQVDCYRGDDLITGQKNIDVCFDIKSNGLGTEQIFSVPANGYIYVNDRAWVEGGVHGKVTLGVASGQPIIIGNNIVYTTTEGADSLGLITDGDVIIPYNSPNQMTIHAAIFAGGSAKRYKYSGAKGQRDKLNILGSISSNQTWTWSYVSMGGASVSGYGVVSTTYDNNLLNNPPLAFPRSVNLDLVSWEEVR